MKASTEKMGDLILKPIFRTYRVQASFMSGKGIGEEQKMTEHCRHLIPARFPERCLTLLDMSPVRRFCKSLINKGPFL